MFNSNNYKISKYIENASITEQLEMEYDIVSDDENNNHFNFDQSLNIVTTNSDKVNEEPKQSTFARRQY